MTNHPANVANTILQQLGGSRFLVMTGAKDLLDIGFGLKMRLPGNMTANGATHLFIRLNGKDLYDVEFHRVRSGRGAVVGYREDVYAEDLRACFTDETGLETSL